MSPVKWLTDQEYQEADDRTKVLAWADSFNGQKEVGQNAGPFVAEVLKSVGLPTGHAWCAAFVWPKQPGAPEAPTDQLFRALRSQDQGLIPDTTHTEILRLRDAYRPPALNDEAEHSERADRVGDRVKSERGAPVAARRTGDGELPPHPPRERHRWIQAEDHRIDSRSRRDGHVERSDHGLLAYSGISSSAVAHCNIGGGAIR